MRPASEARASSRGVRSCQRRNDIPAAPSDQEAACMQYIYTENARERHSVRYQSTRVVSGLRRGIE
ncbi:hypothetical protein PsYK624_111910 [Phanerochaete sordida]|uniref:Uncharacterized protein n=1 Tax=Phanerochaete sordida TaxID=48140 RepID=A0A9P3GHC9_9APHY|nr:hypothetical protein PsYK624_111910 [Phanerochaete sordida]